MGSLRVGHDSVTSLSLFTFMHWRRKWQPTPVFLPGQSQGRGEPGGLPSMGSHSRTRLKRLSSSSSWSGREDQGGNIGILMADSRVVMQKPTHHWKAIILQLKNEFKKEVPRKNVIVINRIKNRKGLKLLKFTSQKEKSKPKVSGSKEVIRINSTNEWNRD